MIINDKERYFQLIEKFEIIPHTQSRGWCEMHSLYKPERIIFIVNDVKNPTIGCFAHVKSFLGLKMLLIEDEAYRDAEAQSLKNIRSFYDKIKELSYHMIEVNSSAAYNPNYEVALRQTGFLKPVGLFSMPLTKIINLQETFRYNQNWKRNLKKSEDYNLSFEVISDVSMEDCEEFISIYAAMNKRKSTQFSFNKQQLFRLLSDPQSFQLFFVKEETNRRIATILIHRSQEKSGLLYAATTGRALETAASFFMYDELFRYLKNEGIFSFDMEKLVASTDSVNHVFNFKNGVQGELKSLNGEWSLNKKKYFRPMMYVVKKYLLKKREI